MVYRNLQYHDNLYKNLKVMLPNSLEYSQSKLNLSTYNNILKNSIISIKTFHYGKCFSRYKSDIKIFGKLSTHFLCKSKNENDFHLSVNK